MILTSSRKNRDRARPCATPRGPERPKRGCPGFALPVALLLCLALGSLAAGAAAMSLLGGRVAVNYDAFQRALGVAEGGLDRGVELLAAAHEDGAPVPDSLELVDDSLGGFAYQVRAIARREPARLDLNGNGIGGEVVRYDRSWGYATALASGTPGDQGEPVRRVTASARGSLAGEDLLLEVAFERDPAVLDPAARGAWRAVPLRWSSLDDPRP